MARFTLPGDVDLWLSFVEEAVVPLQPTLACLSAEAYGSPSVKNYTEEGGLAKAFAQGDADVVEALIVIAADPAHGYLLQAPYRYFGRQVSWEDVSVAEITPGMSGRLIEMIVLVLSTDREFDLWEAIFACKRWGQRVEVAGGNADIVDSARVATRRNDACPCGSGEKVKNCHGRWERH